MGKCNITFVFKHIFEKKENKYDSDFEIWELGVWFRKIKIVGRKNINKPNEWLNNCVNSYMFGINLLIFKFFISYEYNGLNIKY